MDLKGKLKHLFSSFGIKLITFIPICRISPTVSGWQPARCPVKARSPRSWLKRLRHHCPHLLRASRKKLPTPSRKRCDCSAPQWDNLSLLTLGVSSKLMMIRLVWVEKFASFLGLFLSWWVKFCGKSGRVFLAQSSHDVFSSPLPCSICPVSGSCCQIQGSVSSLPTRCCGFCPSKWVTWAIIRVRPRITSAKTRSPTNSLSSVSASHLALRLISQLECFPAKLSGHLSLALTYFYPHTVVPNAWVNYGPH